MQEKTERWQELCRQASTEHDPLKLNALVREICRLLDEKDSRSKTRSGGQSVTAG